MKHLKLSSLLAMLTLFSCQQELQETIVTPEQDGEHISITATAGEPGSKTAVQDGGAIWWSPNDSINVFYWKHNLGKFVSISNEEEPVTVFSSEKTFVVGSLVGGEYLYWGVYPYAEGNTCDGSSVTLSVPAEQTAVANSYDPKAFPSVGCSETQHMAFYNVCGGVRFQIAAEGVRSVTITGNGGEVLAGKVKIGFDQENHPEILEVIEPKSEITLTCEEGFQTGVWYYIATLPGALASGVTFTMYTDSKEASKIIDNSLTIKRSLFGSIASLDEGVTWKKSGMPAANQIFYTSSDEQIVAPYNDAIYDSNGNKLTLTSNIYSNGKGVMTFTGDIDRVGTQYFYNRTKLVTLTLPEGLTKIDASAITNNIRLETLILPESLTSLGTRCFENNVKLSNIPTLGSIKALAVFFVRGCSSLTSIVIPEGVTSIGYYAFSGCSSLTSIVIPEGVTLMGNGAFDGCSSLTSIVIPEGVTSIGYYAFSRCSSLTSIVIPEGVTSIGDYAFYGCSSLTSIVIPESVTSIGYQAFYGCSSLTSIVIPEGVTSIGAWAFYGCSSLTSIVIPEGVTSIGDWAFYGCSSLTSIVIPEGVTSIGDWAFTDCRSLTSIVIPEGVTSIGDVAFSHCSSLSEVNCKPIVPPTIESTTFSYCSALSLINVPMNSVDAYKSATNWSNYASKIQGYIWE